MCTKGLPISKQALALLLPVYFLFRFLHNYLNLLIEVPPYKLGHYVFRIKVFIGQALDQLENVGTFFLLSDISATARGNK